MISDEAVEAAAIVHDSRDELAAVISKALGDVTGIFDTTDSENRALADAILAAGYRKLTNPYRSQA